MSRRASQTACSRSARTGAALTARLFAAATTRTAPDDQSVIRAAIRRRRRTLGLTQEGAARIVGLPRLTYHRIEHGPRHIRLAELATICELFNCDIGDILQDAELAAAARALLADPAQPTS